MFANVLFRLVTTWSKCYTGAFAWESLLGISGPRSRSRCIEMYLVYCVFYVCHLSPSGGGQDGLKGNEGQGWTQASTMVRVVVTCDSRPRLLSWSRPETVISCHKVQFEFVEPCFVDLVYLLSSDIHIQYVHTSSFHPFLGNTVCALVCHRRRVLRRVRHRQSPSRNLAAEGCIGLGWF